MKTYWISMSVLVVSGVAVVSVFAMGLTWAVAIPFAVTGLGAAYRAARQSIMG